MNIYNNKVANLDIDTEVERFQFVPKHFEGELRFHIIREYIPNLSPREPKTLAVIFRSGPSYGNILLGGHNMMPHLSQRSLIILRILC